MGGRRRGVGGASGAHKVGRRASSLQAQSLLILVLMMMVLCLPTEGRASMDRVVAARASRRAANENEAAIVDIFAEEVEAEHEETAALVAEAAEVEDEATDLLSDIAAETDTQTRCTRRYMKRKCRICRSLSLAKFRRSGGSNEKQSTAAFKRCKRNKITSNCGRDAASSFRCKLPTFTSKMSGGGAEGERESPPPSDEVIGQKVELPTPAPTPHPASRPTEQPADCNIIFYAGEYPQVEKDRINFDLVMADGCHLNWTASKLKMDVCVDCPDHAVGHDGCTNGIDIKSADSDILGADEEKHLSIPFVHEGFDLICSYSAKFSGTFQATTDSYQYRYRRDCHLSHLGLPDKCEDVPLEVYYEDFVAEVILLCAEGQEEEEWCRNLDEPGNPIVRVFERALEQYFTDVEHCTYGNEECGPRDILSVTVNNITVTEVDEESGEESRRTEVVARRARKKRRKKATVKGKRRSSGRCRRRSACASREKVDDSITPGRRLLEEGKPEIVEDYDIVVQQRTGCNQTPDLAKSLASIIGEGFYLEDAGVSSISARNCSVDCGTDGECCGTEGCSCTRESVTPSNCLVGTWLRDGNYSSCVLEGEDGANLCCVPAEEQQCPPSWEMQACAAACDELQRPSSDGPPECKLLLNIEASRRRDRIEFALEMTNPCHLGGMVTKFVANVCVDCPDPEATVEQECIHNADILGNMFEQTSGTCLGANETKIVTIPVDVKQEGVDFRDRCSFFAEFTATFEVVSNSFNAETVTTARITSSATKDEEGG